MFSAILAVFQIAWPFLKEAIFGYRPFKTWLKRNYLGVIGLVTAIAMGIMIMGLSRMISDLEIDAAKSRESDKVLMFQISTLTRDNRSMRAKLDSLGVKLDNAVSDDKVVPASSASSQINTNQNLLEDIQ